MESKRSPFDVLFSVHISTYLKKCTYVHKSKVKKMSLTWLITVVYPPSRKMAGNETVVSDIAVALLSTIVDSRSPGAFFNFTQCTQSMCPSDVSVRSCTNERGESSKRRFVTFCFFISWGGTYCRLIFWTGFWFIKILKVPKNWVFLFEFRVFSLSFEFFLSF